MLNSHGVDFEDAMRDLYVDSELKDTFTPDRVMRTPMVQAEFDEWMQSVRSEATFYVIEKLQTSDTGYSRRWEFAGIFYRSREAADAFVEENNAIFLESANKVHRANHEACVHEYREHQALLKAGLRGSAGPRDPGEYKPLASLESHMFQYRVREAAFEDEPVAVRV